MEPVDLSEFTGFLIRRAQQAHVAAWQREVSTETTSVQFGVLALLHRHPGASQRELCDGLDLDRSTIADIVARLQSRGLIERVRDTQDRRRNILHLSRQGEATFRSLIPRVRQMDTLLNDAFTDAERSELHRLLTALLTSPRLRDAIRDE